MSTDTDGQGPSAITTLAGRYHLEEQIGVGGAGSVWRAYDELLGRQVAIKRLHPELERDQGTIDRFRREATAAAALTHPNAVIIYDIGEDQGQAYLVMELVDGPTLADVLRDGPLGPGVAAATGLQVARALGEAHNRGLVHRDVKPANVLLTREGQAKVADFGIAKALGNAQTRLTTPGMIVGTAAYLAPEQLRNAEVDARADVYALGLVLFECVTGEPPFGQGTAAEVAARRLADDVPSPRELRPDLPDDLEYIIRTATRLDPDQRPEDGTAMAALLEPLVSARDLGALASTSRTVPARQHTSVLPPLVAGPAATGTGDAPEPDEAAVTSLVGAPAHGAGAAHRGAATGVSAPQQDRRTAGHQRPNPVAVFVGALLVIAMVVAAVVIADGGAGPDGQPPAGEDPLLTIVDGGDWDPFGDGEHPQDVPNAFDGNPETTWQTQAYRNRPDLGGLKPGVGIWFDVGEVTRLGAIELDFDRAGADLEIYVYEALPDPPTELGSPLGRATDLPAEPRIDLQGAEGRYVLVWFTSLPPDGNRFRIRLTDTRIEAG